MPSPRSIVSRTTGRLWHPCTGNRLASDNNYSYTYDDEGNLIRKVSVGASPTVTWTYDYDVNNRLTSIVETGGGTELYRTTYSYDVFNRRIKEVEDADGAGGGSSVETRFSYDRNTIWADLDSSNNLKVRYVRDSEGGLFARVKSNGDAAWYYTDLWGSTRQLVDNTGALIDTITYDAFGNIASESDLSFGGRFKWIGREHNAQTGLLFSGERYYDANTGGLTSEGQEQFYPEESDPAGLMVHIDSIKKKLGILLSTIRETLHDYVDEVHDRTSVSLEEMFWEAKKGDVDTKYVSREQLLEIHRHRDMMVFINKQLKYTAMSRDKAHKNIDFLVKLITGVTGIKEPVIEELEQPLPPPAILPSNRMPQ